MPPAIRFKFSGFSRLTRIMQIRGVDVYVHWSVLVIAAIMLVYATQQPLLTLAAGLAYLSILLIHECGHMVAARRRGCYVYAIEIYPIHGITRYEEPWSRFDHCIIAWGGVLAQTTVAIPIVIWIAIFGYTRFEPLNAVLVLLGFVSLFIAVFNLIPKPPLDGAIAWEIFPALIKRRRQNRNKQIPRYRSPR